MKFSPVNIEERKKLDVRPGDTVRVYMRVQEGGKTRLQPYEGLVIARRRGSEAGATLTIRKVASGVGMEKIIPIFSPLVSKVEVLKRSKVRRAKLYYIRAKAAKEAARKMKQEIGFLRATALDESVHTEAPATEAPASEAKDSPKEETVSAESK